ncbi:MAG: hypothetical protein HQ564_02855 [Candidatus Saganbacteria bacterium]|nr:hypothetical protein [Candidatus Saganbacteria bacterium]
MGINIDQKIRPINPALAKVLKRIDKEGDRDGEIEIPDIKGTKNQEWRLQNKYRELLTLIGAKLSSSGQIKGRDVVLRLVEYLEQNRVGGSLRENYVGKKKASSGDSILSNVIENTLYPKGVTPHFSKGDKIVPKIPIENSGYCESMLGSMAIQFDFDPAKINKMGLDRPFPLDIPAYIRGNKTSLKYAAEFLGKNTFLQYLMPWWRTRPEQSNPGSSWLSVSIPGATLSDFHVRSGSGKNTVGALFVDKIIPKDKSISDLLFTHLKGSQGGALILEYGQNDLFTMDGFILGRPDGGTIDKEEFAKNVNKIVKDFRKLPHRIIWIKPLKVHLLLNPIMSPKARFTDNSPIPPGKYYSVRPWVDSAKQGARIPRNCLLNQKQYDALVQLQKDYSYAIDSVAAQTNQIIPIDINDRLKEVYDSVKNGGSVTVGGIEFKSKNALFTYDGIHPRRALYAKMGTWIGEKLKSAGVRVKPVDLDKMAKAHPERYRGEKIDEKVIRDAAKVNTAQLLSLKNGNPGWWQNMISIFGQLSFYSAVQTNFDKDNYLGFGLEGILGLRALNVPGPWNTQMFLTLPKLGLKGEFLSDVSGKNKSFKPDLHLGASASTFLSPGTYPWRVTLGLAFHNLQNKPEFGIDLEFLYGTDHAPNIGEAGWNIFAKITGYPVEDQRLFFQLGLGFAI